MNEALFKDIKQSNRIIIIGVSVLADEKLKNKVKDIFEGKNVTILAESDNQLFQMSLLTDIVREKSIRISFEEMKIRRNYFYENLNSAREKIEYLLTALFIPNFIIKTDNNIWYMPVTSFDVINYEKAIKSSKNYSVLKEYIDFVTNKKQGGKYSETPNKEMLELFDQNKVPRGIFPRDSFYNTDHYQYVIWGLVFNREGKLLIHKRSENAKDNQGMWDKSIGGHIDFNVERSSSDAAMRELIEELYTKEEKQQTGHKFSMLSEDTDKVYYLGDWRIEKFGADYLRHVELLENKTKQGAEHWVFYRIQNSFTHNTPRLLPDGKGEKWLRVIVDSYIFIANTDVTEKTIGKMENSQYLLIEPNQLKNWMDSRKDGKGKEFQVTPDLKYIMTGKMRDLIDEVSLTIKYSNIRKI